MRIGIATLLILALGVNAADEPLPKELADLQGVWKLDASEVNGAPVNLPPRPYLWVIAGEKILYGGEQLATLALDTKAKPARFDVAVTGQKLTRLGIYELDGDTLRLCLNVRDDNKDRPRGLPTVNNPTARLFFFQRVKEKIDAAHGMPAFLGIQLNDPEEDVVQIVDVVKNTPAEKAGLKAGDVIRKMDRDDIRTSQGLIERMSVSKSGSTVPFTIRRDGKDRVIDVKLGAVPFRFLE